MKEEIKFVDVEEKRFENERFFLLLGIKEYIESNWGKRCDENECHCIICNKWAIYDHIEKVL
jgi:hypothetical protein